MLKARSVCNRPQKGADVQLDRINPGIVTYGLKPSSTWGQFWGQFHEPSAAPAARSVRHASRSHVSWDQTSNIVIVCNLSATTATAVVTVENYSTPRIESAQSEPRQVTTNPILQMRSTRRSLRDKARKEMSDFEREYPW